MAVQPRSRRRATNVESTSPTVPVHETQARLFIRANIAKNKAAKVERDAKAEVHKSMLACEVNSFDLTEDGKTYDCVIAGGTTDTVSIEKLYGKVTNNDITIEQFLKMVSATQTAVKSEGGTNLLNAVIVTQNAAATLSIKERK